MEAWSTGDRVIVPPFSWLQVKTYNPNGRARLPPPQNATQQMCLGVRQSLVLLETTIPSGSVLPQQQSVYFARWASMCKLKFWKNMTFPKKYQYSLFVSTHHWEALSLWHHRDAVTLCTYSLANSMDICSNEHPFVSGINKITKARDARLITV